MINGFKTYYELYNMFGIILNIFISIGVFLIFGGAASLYTYYVTRRGT
jgi:hypothetical protein